MYSREYITDIGIWYGGDLDPSGARMFVNLKQEIENSFREAISELIDNQYPLIKTRQKEAMLNRVTPYPCQAIRCDSRSNLYART